MRRVLGALALLLALLALAHARANDAHVEPSFAEIAAQRKVHSLVFSHARMAEARARRTGFFKDAINAGLEAAGKSLGNQAADKFARVLGLPPPPPPGIPQSGIPRPDVVVPGVPPQAIDPKAPKTASQMLNDTDLMCVFCQFLVQRTRGEMLMNGIGGGIPFARNNPVLVGSMDRSRTFDTPADAFQASSPPPMRAPPPDGAQIPASGSAAARSGSSVTSLLEIETSALEEEANAPKPDMKPELWGVEGAVPQHLLQPRDETSANRELAQYLAKKQVERAMGITWKTARERATDVFKFRPPQSRYANLYDGPLREARRAQDRYENLQMYSIVYQTIEDICTKKSPKAFYATCVVILRHYQEIAEGLKWKDRPDAICMEMTFCGKDSYIRKNPHAVYKDY
jgi:hypothetical protein